MKVRLYHDERLSAKNALDAWSIYCPYPRKYQKITGVKGIFLGCSPTVGGLIRCCWDSISVGQKVYLGRRKGLSCMPKDFQDVFHQIENAYQNALKKDTLEAWKKFNSF